MLARLIAIFILCLACPSAAWAEGALTLEQAFAIAAQNNPQFKAAQARLGISAAEILTAAARPNPFLFSDNGIAEKTYRLGLEQRFELGGKRRKRVDVAEARRDSVDAGVGTALLDLRASVRRSYTQLYNAQERERAMREIARTSEELMAIAEKREQAGDVAALDVLQADITALSARNDLQVATLQVVEARNRLNTLLNRPLGTSVKLAPPPGLPKTEPKAESPGAWQAGIAQAELDLPALLAAAYRHRPEWRVADTDIKVARLQRELARAERIPDLRLAAGPEMVFGNNDAYNAFIVGAVDIPLFDRRQGPIREAEARLEQLTHELAAVESRIALEVTNACASFAGNRDRVERYEAELLPRALAIVEKSWRAYEEGKSPVMVPIQARQAYVNTRLGYLQALLDYQNAVSDLERAVGVGL